MTNRTASWKWRQTRARVLNRSRVCHVCGKLGADEVDHIKPVALGGPEFDEANLAPIHAVCNRRKGTRAAPIPRPSRDW